MPRIIRDTDVMVTDSGLIRHVLSGSEYTASNIILASANFYAVRNNQPMFKPSNNSVHGANLFERKVT